MKYQFSNYNFDIDYINRFLNTIDSHQNTILDLLKYEVDEKKSEQYEKDLNLISNFRIQLTKYQGFLNKHSQ